MKNDPTFKVLALAIIAGVIVSFVNPARDTSPASHVTAAVTVVQMPTADATE